MDTIRVINNIETEKAFDNAFDFLESNFEIRYNDKNPENKVDEYKLYRMYMLKNMSIKLYANRVSLQGSIPIYYSGTNINELNDNDITDAFKSIQFQLPFINWSKGIVSRLDIGPCLKVPFNPNIVSKLITGGKNSSKTTYKSIGNTVMIGNKSHQFVIYNKSAQSGLDEDNILRLEYRMLKSAYVGKMFKQPNINLSYLLKNLKHLPEIWFTMYQKLEKDYTPAINWISDKTSLKHAAYYTYGYEKIISLIDNSYRTNKLTRSQNYNMKRYIRDMQRDAKQFACADSPMVILDELVDEYIHTRRR